MNFIITLLFLVLLFISDIITTKDNDSIIKSKIMINDTLNKMFPNRRLLQKIDEVSDILKEYFRITDDIVLQMALTKAVLFETIDGIEYGIYSVIVLDKSYLTLKYAENPYGTVKPEHIQRMRSEGWFILMNMVDSSLAVSIPPENIVTKIKLKI